jgi:DNA mismatch endonuclease (patch repair protein)
LLAGARRETDIVFGSTKVAVYVDGCFWHGCPEHYRPPTTNPEYWLPKIERNRSRDRETETLLASSGWLVVRVWEHEDTDAAAERVSRTVLGRRAAAAPSKKATPE